MITHDSRWSTRAAVALAFAALTGTFATARVAHEPNWPTDFDQLWHAARALRDGIDPYSVVGPDRPFAWLWPLYYPFPAVLVALPFSWLPVPIARVAFTTVGAGILGWAMGPKIRTHWPLLLSASYIIASSRTQWTPMLLAAMWLPAFGFLATAKPNVGIAALLAIRPPRRLGHALAGCIAMVAVSFLIRPDWMTSWLDGIARAPHIQAAVTVLPAGPLLGLALLRWRRPEAWLFLGLVAIPHTPSLYDLLLLFFGCRRLRESLALAVLTQALFWGIVLFGSFPTFDAYAEGLGRAAIYVVYLPVLVALLARPNRTVDDTTEDGSSRTGIRIIPSNWPDTVLLAMLLVGATMLIWLPLMTYR